MGDARHISGEQGRIDGAERFTLWVGNLTLSDLDSACESRFAQAVSIAIHFAADINPTYTEF